MQRSYQRPARQIASTLSLLTLLLLPSACSRYIQVSLPAPKCSKYVPKLLKAPTPGAAIPLREVDPSTGQQGGNLQVGPWLAFANAQTGQLGTANARTDAVLEIIQVCEDEYDALVKSQTKKPWWKIGG